jgi:protein SCO1
VLLVVVLQASACGPRTTQYPLKGQVIGLAPERKELTVNQQDIPGLMAAMTMPYRVKDVKLLDGLVDGDLITASVVVRGSEMYLTDVRKTGHALLPAEARAARVMDVMEPGDIVPDDVLQDQDGHPRKLSDWRGRALGVTFIYTRCPLPDFCPLMDRNFEQVQRAIEGDPELRARVHLVSVSFDPRHDTPAVLKDHASSVKAHGEVWSFLTGAPDAVGHVAERFGVAVIPEQDTIQSITHNLRTAVIDPQGRLATMYSGNEWKPAQMIDALRHALKTGG